uniref:Uncharacterized protein n=1 Tax=Arundo donax TaxID=35708 RepID=A0A0A9DKC6_ARUDO
MVGNKRNRNTTLVVQKIQTSSTSLANNSGVDANCNRQNMDACYV